MDDIRPRCLRATADVLPFGTDWFDLVISINTIHNLPLDRCKHALAELTRVSRGQCYVQVDSWLTEEQHENFERWQLTAQTYFDPTGWRQLFDEVGYTGDYYWTITE
jgi:ubiquinone/menaquinone biosynthesis C-methylase UbiE